MHELRQNFNAAFWALHKKFRICKQLQGLNESNELFQQRISNNRSPDLVVIGWNLESEGRGFEYQHNILDGHCFTLICCKNCIGVCLKKTENEAEDSPIKNAS